MSGSVRVLYFASLREQLGVASEALELPSGIATVDGLRAHLMRRGDAWQRTLASGKALRVAVNQDMAEPATPVKPGDEVAFFPPVTGG
jgi:molybdopterin synthase sulfur carrier subunit